MVRATPREIVKRFSDRIVDAQRPIRILDAIKWSPRFEDELRRSKLKKLPKYGPEEYARENPLSFDPDARAAEFRAIISDLDRELGRADGLGDLLIRICEEYVLVCEMLQARGTKRFHECSRRLYGSPRDTFVGDINTIVDMAEMMYSTITAIGQNLPAPAYPEDIPALEAVRILNERFGAYFGEDSGVVAEISDGIVADAAAGGEKVKLKQGKTFSLRQIEVLEVHEGWVHVGTTINGNLQRVGRWLSKGPPRCSATQEGLAVMMEVFTFRSHTSRLQKINNRILAIAKAEEGASLLDVIEFYRTEGFDEDECVAHAWRVFRGGVIGGGAPFTKDISYCRGFVENYNFIRTAIRLGRPQLIPFLFAGKLHVDDVPLVYQKHLEGWIDPPKHLPPQFRDLNGVAAWMAFSSFFNRVDLKSVQEHYRSLFERFS